MDSRFRVIRARNLTLIALALLLCQLSATATEANEKKTLYAGRPLTKVLEELRADGLEIIYSSRLVQPEMRVVEEPSSTVPRRILDEILSPHGLKVRSGSDGNLLVIRKPKEKLPDSASPGSDDVSNEIHFREAVDVFGETDRRGVGTDVVSLDGQDVMEVPGAVDNVFRTLQILPGVAATSELGSGIAVQGGAPEQNLIIMDGVEIYNPYRLFGFTSAFNPETVDTFEFSRGGFGTRFGDRLSSVLAVDNRLGKKEKLLQGSLGVSITDANFVLEGKLPRGSWLFAGRRTYYDFITDAAFLTTFPSFRDLQTKMSWELGAGRRLSVTGLLGRERRNLDTGKLDSQGQTAEVGKQTFALFSNSNSGEDVHVGGETRTALAAVNFVTPLADRALSKSTVSFYRFQDDFDFSGLLDNGVWESRSRGPVLAEVGLSRGVEIADRAFRQELILDPWRGHEFELGFEIHSLATAWRYDIDGVRSAVEPNASGISLDTHLLPGVSVPAELESEVDGVRWGAWVQDRFFATPRITLQPGLRIGRSGINRKTGLAPRLRATFDVTLDTRLRASTGLYFQSPGYEKLFQADYFVDLSDEATRTRLDNERAFVTTVGVDRVLHPGLTLNIDGYYKRLSNVLVGRLETEAERTERIARYDFPAALQGDIPRAPLITVNPVSSAEGRAWGLDISLSRTSSATREPRLTGWVTYGYGVANRDAYGRRFPFDYDRRHAGSLVAKWQISRSMDISATGRFASGFPRTPALGVRVAAEDDGGSLVPARDEAGLLVFTQDFGDVSNLNTARRPTFARVDARFTYRTGGGEGQWLLYFEIVNLLNRNNTLVVSPEIDFRLGRPVIREEHVASLPFVPNFGVRFQF